MKRLCLLFLFFVSSLYSDTALIIHKGWQLIGTSSKITDLSVFTPQHVEQIWHFDAATQQWKGYSPDPEIAPKITEKGYGTVTSLESWHGFWIKSKDEWVLTLPTENGSSDENITLQKGWNLISLPVDTVVSPHIFDGNTVWKYANNRWEFFDKEANENFPAISHITNSEGIWVKSNHKQTISVATDAAKLHNFTSSKEMEAYIRDMLLTDRRDICGYFPITALRAPGMVVADEGGATKDAAPAFAQDEAQNASQTNIQEARVDEADIIKHNNRAIFFLYRDNSTPQQTKIGITTFSEILNGKTEPLTTITPRGNPDALYLAGDKLIVLSANRVIDTIYETPKQTAPAKTEKTKREFTVPAFYVEIYDVKTFNAIHKLHEFKIDGYLKTSRLIQNKLYLVSQFSPIVNVTYPRIYVNAPECKNYFFGNPVPPETSDETETNTGSGGSGGSVPPFVQNRGIVADDYKQYARCYGLSVDEKQRFYRPDYEHPHIISEYLIPKVHIDNTLENVLITPETVYAPAKIDQQAVITTVTKIDLDNTQPIQTASILGYPNTVYASQKALYLVSDRYPIYYSFDRFKRRSVIYKFALGDQMGYRAAGFVNGTPLNQFSLSEYHNILRIATSEGFSWLNNTVNTLYTLKTVQNNLIIQGVLSGLGKEGETIRAVRFMGDKGYIVTFKQTDPFYTLDLSDPSHPKKIGQLQIDGFSSYLHPISENLILGFGRDATPQGQTLGLKLELFDVSDFAHPVSLDSYTLPGNYNRSEVEHNHKALAYRNSDKLFAFAYNANEGYHSSVDYLGIFQIAQNAIKVYHPIQGDQNSYSIYQRGLIFDINGVTYVAYFSNGKIKYRKLENLGVLP